jgi:histidinol-phosphate aminotransferase
MLGNPEGPLAIAEGASMDWDRFIRAELADMRAYAPGLRASEVRSRSGKDHILKLSSNEHPAGPVDGVVEAIAEAAAGLNRYPDGAATALRDRVAERLDVSESAVIVGSGSNEILRLIAQALLRPGDEVVYGWPSFVVYPMVTAMFGGVSVQVPLADSGGYALDDILGAITERTRIVFLCNPNNPTGGIYDRTAFQAFMDSVPEHVLVVSDEAYFEFVEDPDYPDGLEWFDAERPFVVARTFSKVYALAGLRVGYAVAPPAIVEAAHKVREPFNVNTLAQVAACHSLGADDEIARRAAENAATRAEFEAFLDGLGARRLPSQANFVYVQTDRPREVFGKLLTEGVIVRDFGTSPALRVGIPAPEDLGQLCDAFRAVADEFGGV